MSAKAESAEAGAPEVTEEMIAAAEAVLSRFGVIEDLADGSESPYAIVSRVLEAAIAVQPRKA